MITLSGTPYKQTWFGLSTDQKPMLSTPSNPSNSPFSPVMIGDYFIETDTGNRWRFAGPPTNWFRF